MIFGREPALVITAIATLIQAALIFVNNDASVTAAGVEVWLTPLMTILAGLFVRQKVMPVQTIREAGFSPHALKIRAEDPGIAPHRE